MKNKHFTDEQKGIFFLLLIFLIIAAVVIILVFSIRTDVVAENIANDQVIKLLFVVDDGEKERNALFSNVIVYYPVSKRALTVNIPGNTGAIYQSLNRVDRIDDVYKEKGIAVYRNEIEKLLDIKIPFSLVIKLNDFIKITDMLGGFRVFIPSPVDITEESGTRYLLPSGAVTLDGDKIKTYLKYQDTEEDDADVYERYQNVVMAFLLSIHDERTTIFSKHSIFSEYQKLMSVNLRDFDDVFRLFSIISDMDSENIGRQTITGRIQIIDNERLLFPINNGDFIKEAVKQSINMLVSNSGTMSSRVYVLEIKNGTPIQGLAHNTAVLFRNASYDVLSAVNADSNNYEKTMIIDHIGNPEIASMVGNFIRCTNIVEEKIDISEQALENDSGADVDFTIILGKDFDGRYVR